MTIDVQPTGSVRTGSPVIYRVTEADPDTPLIIADITAWTGLQSAKPAQYNYRLRKTKRPDDTATFDVSTLVKELIEQRLPSDLVAAQDEKATTEAAWLQVSFGHINAAGTVTANTDTSQFVLCTRGFSSFYEGDNEPLPSGFLTDSKDVRIGRDNLYVLGINTTAASTAGKIRLTVENTTPIDFAINNTGSKLDTKENIRYFDVSPSFLNITTPTNYSVELLTAGDSEIDQVNFRVKDCAYENQTIAYESRNGIWQYFPFNGKQSSTVDYKDSTYQRSAIDGWAGQFRRFNVEGRYSVTMNTDYVTEEQNLEMNNLLMSEYCFHMNSGTPVIPTTKSLLVKDGRNDKLIQYTISFIEAYNFNKQTR